MTNKLTLNIQKSKYIIFSSDTKLKRLKNQNLETIQINDSDMEKVSSIKFLGVMIKENLKWDLHIDNICLKIAKSIGIINKLKYTLPTQALLTLYNTLIVPHFNYCIGVWGNTEKYNSERLILLQKRAGRCIANASYIAHTAPIFKLHNILTFNDMVVINALVFMYKYFNNMLPHAFDSYFKSIRTHTHNTRYTSLLTHEKFRSELFRKTVKVFGPNNWNKLPTEIKSIRSLTLFKKKLKLHFYHKY